MILKQNNIEFDASAFTCPKGSEEFKDAKSSSYTLGNKEIQIYETELKDLKLANNQVGK